MTARWILALFPVLILPLWGFCRAAGWAIAVAIAVPVSIQVIGYVIGNVLGLVAMVIDTLFVS
jgi:hypothetical protein